MAEYFCHESSVTNYQMICLSHLSKEQGKQQGFVIYYSTHLITLRGKISPKNLQI